METFAPRFPRPDFAGPQHSPSAYERGRANDTLVHAIRGTLAGMRPLCDDSLRVTWLDGRFAPFDDGVCVECSRRTGR